MRNLLFYRYFPALALLSCLLAACSPPAVDQPAANTDVNAAAAVGTRGGTAVYRLTSAPTTFNYLLAADESTVVTAFFLLGSRLVDFDHRSQKYVPALAESWTVAADGRTVDLKLRDGLKFSDGTEMTADDVVFTLAAIYDERTESPAFKDSLLIGGKPIEVKAVDRTNLQMVFPEPVAAVENYLINIAVLPQHALKADFDAGRLSSSWPLTADPRSIVTSGPFTLESAAAGERVTIARNAHFWKKDSAGTRLPYLDRLVIEIVPDPNNAVARLNEGSIDIIDRIRPSDFASLSATPGPAKAVDVGPGLGTDHMWFNLNPSGIGGSSAKRAWFNDSRFRTAISAAIDRQSIASSAMRGLATPIYGFVSPANRQWANPEISRSEYSPDTARKILQDAGYSVAGSPDAPQLRDAAGNAVEFTLLVPAENEPRKLMAAVIQEDLAKLGIKMNVAPVEFQVITQRWSESFDYDAILLGLSVTDIEPSSYANFLLSSAAVHQWRPGQKAPATEWEARIDELFAEQAAERDPQKRAVLFNEIQMIMAAEMPIIPIVARHVVSAANTRIGNYSPSPIMPYSLWNAEELFIVP